MEDFWCSSEVLTRHFMKEIGTGLAPNELPEVSLSRKLPAASAFQPFTSMCSLEVGKKLREKMSLPLVGRPKEVAGSILASKNRN